jgi:diguanylate cyclase (GGDEF)-like protein
VAVRGTLRVLAHPVAEAESQMLALGCLVSGLYALFHVFVPFSPTAPQGLIIFFAALAFAVAALVWAARRVLPRGAAHGVLVLGTAALTLGVAASTTDAGPAVTAYGYVWLGMFAAWFHPGRAAAVHLALIAAGLALGLHLSDAPAAQQTWLAAMTCFGVVIVTLNLLVMRLRRMAHHDVLTGLRNRAAVTADAERALALAERHARPVSLAIIDLDDFKLVNDRDGHAAGDRLLVELATAWQSVVRREDVLARYGGDEFLLLMPETGLEAAGRVLERMAGATEACGWTAGIAQWQAGEDLDGWLRRADGDLYRRKAGPDQAGRRRPTPTWLAQQV